MVTRKGDAGGGEGALLTVDFCTILFDPLEDFSKAAVVFFYGCAPNDDAIDKILKTVTSTQHILLRFVFENTQMHCSVL